MKIGNLAVTFHRTVRVADGRQPSNLPPSLGRIELYRVSEYADKCSGTWEKEGFFAALHETEAMWMYFQASLHPVAVLVGAGGVNALTGEKLGTTLEKDNYLVTPPQPWLDGWKDKDGTVYQFVATGYKGGKGNTVAEQLIGEESKTGALGIAVFDPEDPKKLKPINSPHEGYTSGAYEQDFHYTGQGTIVKGSVESLGMCSSASAHVVMNSAEKLCRARSFSEMGVGKGGKIIQKIYTDAQGIDAWQDKPSATLAIYLVNAQVFKEITGIVVPAPVGHEAYQGAWYGMNDTQEQDVAGSGKFTGLKSAVFPASTLAPQEPEEAPKEEEAAVK